MKYPCNPATPGEYRNRIALEAEVERLRAALEQAEQFAKIAEHEHEEWRVTVRGSLAERDRLRSQLHDLQFRVDKAHDAVVSERDALRAEVEELRGALSGRTVSCVCGGEVERLRAALEKARSHIQAESGNQLYWSGQLLAAAQIIDKALAATK